MRPSAYTGRVHIARRASVNPYGPTGGAAAGCAVAATAGETGSARLVVWSMRHPRVPRHRTVPTSSTRPCQSRAVYAGIRARARTGRPGPPDPLADRYVVPQLPSDDGPPGSRREVPIVDSA